MINHQLCAMLLLVLTSAANGACSGGLMVDDGVSGYGSDVPSASGGATGQGGTTGTVTVTTAGKSPRGGTPGSGGSPVVGSGGTTVTTTPMGIGGAGTTSASTRCFDFATSTEGWKKNYAFVSSTTDKTTRDAMASDVLLANTVVEWLDAPGYGGAQGFVRLAIPFAMSQIEYQSLLFSYLPPTGLDLAGRTIHAFVKIVSGMTADDPSKPSGAKLVVKSGADYFYADGGWVNLSKNEWVGLMLDVSSPANMDYSKDASLFDPADIREISVEFDTSGSATTVVSPGVLYLDRVCY
jgi:hypothetical protein